MKAKAWRVESGVQRIFHKIFLVEFSLVTCNEGLKLIERKDFLRIVFGQVFCFLSPRWLAQLVCTSRGYNPLLSLNRNSKEKYFYYLQAPWQDCALPNDRNTMLRCARSVYWLDFSFLSIFFSTLSMALPNVYMIFRIIWPVANGQLWRPSCFPHFWSPCLPCFDGSCFPDWMKTGWGPFSVNFNISKLSHHIF